jgi:hypothetical protein
MPSWLDIWSGGMKVFAMQWCAWHGDGHARVLTYKPGDWEDVLRRAAGV